VALTTSVYSLAVSSIAIVLGQRLAIQATAEATVKHESNVTELQNKFKTVLIALLLSLVGVVGATLCAMWARVEDPPISIVATALFAVCVPVTVWALITMSTRLNDSRDESSSLHLKAEKASLDVSEFRIGDASSIPSKTDIEAGMGVTALGAPKTDERSSLLKCAPPGLCGGPPKSS